ncbi:MAG: NOL1/NOP2/sun family putative RNA methylase [Leptolyngbyaceae cyanobacterium]
MIRLQPAPDEVAAILARYGAIVDDFQQLLEVARKPLPVCLWHNPLKCTVNDLQHYGSMNDLVLVPVRWQAGAYRVSGGAAVGHTLPFTAGWFYIQEEIAMVAVAALAPRPGERILDLCAAPGGKTAQIAVRVNAGTVVANEMNAGRSPSLMANLNRLGFTQTVITQADGRSLALPPQTFDRVLGDAPCSGEGNLRRRRRRRPWQATYGLRIAKVQKKLLSCALDLVRPGGTVVYSTCTFAPEENEAVLDAVMGDRAVVVPFQIEGLRAQPGLTQWQGNAYRQDLTNAHRYFPHLNDTGGFFVAKLRRTFTPPRTTAIASNEPAGIIAPTAEPIDGPASPLAEQCKRLAIAPAVMAPYGVWATGKRRLWLLEQTSHPPAELSWQTAGLSLATYTNLGLKPSTAFLQRFGPAITQNVISLADQHQVAQFLQGRSQALKADVEPGYVHVRYQQFELGCGRYRDGWLESQIPKMLRWPTAPEAT